jgi:hypothetical protein
MQACGVQGASAGRPIAMRPSSWSHKAADFSVSRTCFGEDQGFRFR